MLAELLSIGVLTLIVRGAILSGMETKHRWIPGPALLTATPGDVVRVLHSDLYDGDYSGEEGRVLAVDEDGDALVDLSWPIVLPVGLLEVVL